MKHEMIEKVVKTLRDKGIEAQEIGDMVAVSRTSMCQSEFSGKGLPEESTYPNVLSFVKKTFPGLNLVNWCGKTDEVLFLEGF